MITCNIDTTEKKEHIKVRMWDNSISGFSEFVFALTKRNSEYTHLMENGFDISAALFYTTCDFLSLDFYQVEEEIGDIIVWALEREYSSRNGGETFTDDELAVQIVQRLSKHNPFMIDYYISGVLFNLINDIFDIIGDEYLETVADFIKASFGFSGSADFQELLDDFGNLTWGGNAKDIMEDLINAVDIFRDFVFLQNYIDLTEENTNLRDVAMFRACVNKFMWHTNLTEFLPVIPRNSPLARTPEHPTADEIIQRVTYNSNGKYNIKCDNVASFICSQIQYILDNGMTIKRCKNCGKYFVAYNRSDTECCDRAALQNPKKTCKEYNSQDLYYEKVKANPAKNLYRKIYQQKQMLVKRNPDIDKYRQQFENFKTTAKEWKQKLKAGEAKEDDYYNWLKEVRQKEGVYNGND